MKKLYFTFWVLLAGVASAQNPAAPIFSFINPLNEVINYDPDPRVWDFALQPDGKIIMAGYFEFNNGLGPNIIRLNSDGSIDNTFNSGTGFDSYDNAVNELILQPDGKIIARGQFTSYNGTPVPKMVRLNPDGSIDPSFNIGTGFDWHINTIALQADGKIVVGGGFLNFNGNPAKRIARLNPDGSRDLSFPDNGFTDNGYSVTAITIQPDGKLLVGGNFGSYFGTTSWRMIRLNPDGTVDTSFVLPENGFGPLPPTVITLQQDGKILVGGDFNYFGGELNRKLVRLNPDGSKDTSFLINNLIYDEDSSIRAIAIKPNGKIVIGGNFYDSNYADHLAILDPDGTFDTAPQIGFNNPQDGVYAITVLPNGELLVGGYFSHYNDVWIRSFVKLLGTDYYRFEGKSKIDLDANGCSPTDIISPNMKFEITNGATTTNYFSNNNGEHSVYLQNGINTITPMPVHPSYFTISPPNVIINYPSAPHPSVQDFCLTPNGVHNDLQITIIPTTPAIPGFEAEYKLLCTNTGNTVQSGSISLTYNNPLLTLTSSNPAIANQDENWFAWEFNNLNPLQTIEIDLVLTLNTPQATPPANAGDNLAFTATITSAETEETPEDNTFIMNQTIVNSLDPNDKTCIEGTTVMSNFVGEYVHYLIRFENTGTYAAQNVIIKDIIDTTKFDVSTLQPVDGSHSFITRITEGNVVEFIFENIQLPFQDGQNDGYLSFRIKTLSTLSVGDEFSNSASIYFDYNDPIITNTAVTAIVVLDTESFKYNTLFTLYPNPVNSELTIKSDESAIIRSVSIYNTLGQLIITTTADSNKTSLDVSFLEKGNYFVKIQSDKGVSTNKLIKM